MKLPCFLLPFLLLAASARGQARPAAATTVSVAGIVMDDSGAVLEGSQGLLVNLRTLDIHRSGTDSGGHFIFSDVQPGTYELIVAPPPRFSCVESAVKRLRLKTGGSASPLLRLSFHKGRFVE